MRVAVSSLLLAAMLLAVGGCEDARRTTRLPPDPPGVTRPDESPFGDTIRQADWRAQRQVLDQLEARFGARTFRLKMLVAPHSLDPLAINEHEARGSGGRCRLGLALQPTHEFLLQHRTTQVIPLEQFHPKGRDELDLLSLLDPFNDGALRTTADEIYDVL
ncbi:hypothetical protein OCOJLMKI_3085 [Methylobacterium iners]|uniref:Lipoprotein n=1 Tax=Methylobacterium iners TaxID=418707 RepID=A0ABQ4S079_9HYPH|nr:hypothetical protein OCOJLMKI_3085 [Methylobacterium iners]